MIVFGGGNEGIVDELHVYNTGKFAVDSGVLRAAGVPLFNHYLLKNMHGCNRN